MNENPKYRQEWILDCLKANPTQTYNDTFTNYLQKFTNLSRQTFTTDWNKANTIFSTYQEAINKAKLDESIKLEKQAVKRNILSKNDALEILSNIAQGKSSKVKTKIDGKEVEQLLVPSYNDRNSAIKTIGEFEGWKSPAKTEIKHDFVEQPLFPDV